MLQKLNNIYYFIATQFLQTGFTIQLLACRNIETNTNKSLLVA